MFLSQPELLSRQMLTFGRVSGYNAVLALSWTHPTALGNQTSDVVQRKSVFVRTTPVATTTAVLCVFRNGRLWRWRTPPPRPFFPDSSFRLQRVPKWWRRSGSFGRRYIFPVARHRFAPFSPTFYGPREIRPNI